MKNMIAGLAAMVLLITAAPVSGMPMMLSGSYPVDVYALSTAGPDYAHPGSTLHTGILNASGVEGSGKGSVIEPSDVVPILSSDDPASLSSLWMRFQNAKGTGTSDGTASHPVPDLVIMLFLGIGMLSLGGMRKREPSPH